MDRAHAYHLDLTWEGNTGEGTAAYRSYDRRYRIQIAGKPDLVGSADPTFLGDPGRHNPEELLVAALSACHLLSYLALCARRGLRVLAYRDRADGTMVTTRAGGGRFERVLLRPHVTVAPGSDLAVAQALHHDAHAACFIAASCNFEVACEPEVVVATADTDAAADAPAVRVRRDLAVRLPHQPGGLATFAEALGAAGISLEGGGGFTTDGTTATVHFLVADAERAADAARAAGLEVLGVRDVLVRRLEQETPGQLAAITRALATAGIGIDCMYSDHDHQLILVVDDLAAADRATTAWRSGPAA